MPTVRYLHRKAPIKGGQMAYKDSATLPNDCENNCACQCGTSDQVCRCTHSGVRTPILFSIGSAVLPGNLIVAKNIMSD